MTDTPLNGGSSGAWLRRWRREPTGMRLLVALRGDRGELEAFLQEWIAREGEVDLPATQLDPRCVPPPPGKLNYLIEIPPSRYAWVFWWMDRQPTWSLFYSADTGQVHTSYLPFGYELDVAAEVPHLSSSQVLWGSEWIPLGARKVSLLEYGQLTPRFSWKDQPRTVMAAAEGLPVPVDISLRICVRATVSRRSEGNVNMELQRVTEAIAKLERSRHALLWQGAISENREIYVYPETAETVAGDGSARGLLLWAADATQEELNHYHHARLSTSLGVLHFLRCQGEKIRGAPPPAPYPEYRLRMQQSWLPWGSEVFVTNGFELLPHPPLPESAPGEGHGTPCVVRALKRALWESEGTANELLIFIKPHAEDEEPHRILLAHAAFRPLGERVEALNGQVLARSGQISATNSGLGRALDAAARTMAHALGANVGRIRNELDGEWKRRTEELNRYEKDIAELEQRVSSLGDALGELRDLETAVRGQLQGRVWGDWRDFVNSVLALDRALLPLSRKHLFEALEASDSKRAALAAEFPNSEGLEK